MNKEPELDLAGKDILLLEDIVDSGITMAWLHDYFTSKHQPTSVRTCALIDKHERRAVEVKVDYAGFPAGQGLSGLCAKVPDAAQYLRLGGVIKSEKK